MDLMMSELHSDKIPVKHRQVSPLQGGGTCFFFSHSFYNVVLVTICEQVYSIRNLDK